MWILNNETPFPADHVFLADRDGGDTYVICVKATYDIAPDGSCTVAAEQVPPDHVPRHRDPDKASSLLADCDFDFMKPGTDVLVIGSCINPDPSGRPEVEVGVSVGPIRKRLRVTGERLWLHGPMGPVLTDPAPFQEMPVIWENAFGGVDPGRDDSWLDPRNPLGTGIARGSRGVAGTRAPTVLMSGESYDGRDSAPAPAGFGPIERHWVPRRDHAGTYDEAWQRDRAPLWARDLDERFFMAAPADQQCIPPLDGTEEVRVVNMTPGGHLGFRLPSFRPYANVRIDGATFQIKLRVATVAVLPNNRRVVVSWCGSLPCQGKRERIDNIDLWDKPLVRGTVAASGTE